MSGKKEARPAEAGRAEAALHLGDRPGEKSGRCGAGGEHGLGHQNSNQPHTRRSECEGDGVELEAAHWLGRFGCSPNLCRTAAHVAGPANRVNRQRLGVVAVVVLLGRVAAVSAVMQSRRVQLADQDRATHCRMSLKLGDSTLTMERHPARIATGSTAATSAQNLSPAGAAIEALKRSWGSHHANSFSALRAVRLMASSNLTSVA